MGVPSISRLFNLDCRYPRDQLQPARKKKIPLPLLCSAGNSWPSMVRGVEVGGCLKVCDCEIRHFFGRLGGGRLARNWGTDDVDAGSGVELAWKIGIVTFEET